MWVISKVASTVLKQVRENSVSRRRAADFNESKNTVECEIDGAVVGMKGRCLVSK